MRTVLVVDHVHAGAEALMARLRAAGWTVMNLAGVEEAVELTNRTKVDLIILELLLMRVGGLEVLRRLRQRGSEIPVVVYTCLDSAPMLAEAQALGAARCCVKSKTCVDELVGAIDTLITPHPSKDAK